VAPVSGVRSQRVVEFHDWRDGKETGGSHDGCGESVVVGSGSTEEADVRGSIGGLVLAAIVAVGSGAASSAGFGEYPPRPKPAADAPVVTVGASGQDHASLAEAVAAAPAGSVLELAAEVFTEGGIVLDKDLFLRGAAGGATVIQPSGSAETSTDRVFTVAEGATVVFSDLTLRHGNPQGECPRGGGAVLNYGTSWMERCILSDNLGQCGGGLLNRDGTVYAFDCMILRNRAHGGADITGVQGMGAGGGIKNAVGAMHLERCTIADNVSRKKGGAIKNCCLATLTMINCTVVGNECKTGGIHLNGPALIDHCTIAFNTAPLSYGAGVYVDSPSVIRNSLIAHNSLGDVAVETESDGALARFENIWIGNDRTGVGTFSGDPLLGPLQDNGGPTWTCLLLPGSGAIDAAVVFGDGPSEDQRGNVRVRDPAPDLGAVEMPPDAAD